MQTHRMPPATLSVRYRMQMVQSSFDPSVQRSFAKVENVVNPPQNPVTSSRLWLGERILVFSSSPKNRPMRKHPMMFTRNVARGNESCQNWAVSRLIIYRPAVPMNPPHPAIIISLIISDSERIVEKRITELLTLDLYRKLYKLSVWI